MDIRFEKPEDANAVRNVHVAAFQRENEANLVEQLRGIASTFSFVAVEAEQVLGHVFYSPVELEGEWVNPLCILGLAPVAVLPNRQRQGIGTLLIRHSLAECARQGCKAVVVLGHPEYYPRFGFTSAQKKGFRSEYTVPDEVFMVLELESDAFKGCSGILKYRPEFSAFE
jgi:putative acetyltransferase